MIYQGRYVVDEPLVDGAFRLCALYERQLPTPEETADEICADWHMHAAFHLLADHGGPLDPDAPRLPGRGTQAGGHQSAG